MLPPIRMIHGLRDAQELSLLYGHRDKTMHLDSVALALLALQIAMPWFIIILLLLLLFHLQLQAVSCEAVSTESDYIISDISAVAALNFFDEHGNCNEGEKAEI